MSVLTYLTDLSSTATIPNWERNSIDALINKLSIKLGNYFDNVGSQFVFGSYDRKTILRKSKDANSIIDYMVCFNDGSNCTPQTLINRLKEFTEVNYSKNEICQSSPTVIIEISDLKFELMPAYYTGGGTYYIPDPTSNYLTWIDTCPKALKINLNDKNHDNDYQIRKLVRLLKYWNVLNGKVYSSYELEKYVIDKSFLDCTNQKDYFFQAVEGLPMENLPYCKESKVNLLQAIVVNTKKYEEDDMPYTAESEIKKIFE